jgi:uncharacterized protein YdaU (DUF1376 family)
MAELPALPLWTDAYLADTGHLTTIEHGAYLLLLMAMWRAGGSLPNDDKKLMRFAHLNAGQWHRMRETLMEFFNVEGDQIVQGRLTDELSFVRQHRAKQSNNARAKYRKNNNSTPAMGVPNASQIDAPTPTPISIEETPIVPKGTRRRKTNGFDHEKYEEFEENVWQVFPRQPNSRKEPAFKSYDKLSEEDRGKCIGGAIRYASRFDGTDDPKRSKDERLNYVPHLSTWINQKGWESEYDRQS